MRRLTARVDFTLPTQVKDRIKKRASQQGISMSEYIRRAAHEYAMALERSDGARP